MLFVTKEEFNCLWKLQKRDAERQIILQKLEQNKYFRSLNTLTKYYLVYEALEEKIFFPGEQIMSIHQRSPLCADFIDFYKPCVSKFKRDIDSKMVTKENTTGG